MSRSKTDQRPGIVITLPRMFALLFGCLLATPAIAQPVDLSFHHLTTAEGLSQSINSFIYRDARGFVWISSMDGLNRFDGLGVKVYRPDASDPAAILGNNIQSPFFEDEAHNLWFCTYDAINCYRRATDDFSHFRVKTEQGPAENGYRVFYRDPQGRVWAQVGRDAYWLIPPATNDAEPVQKRLGELDAIKCFPVVDPANGALTRIYGCYVRFRNGLTAYSVSVDSIRLTHRWLDGSDGNDSARIYHVFPDGTDLLWLGTDKGLRKFDPSNGKALGLFHRYQGQEIGTVRGITAMDANFLLVSCERGLLLFDKRNLAFVRQFVHEENNPLSLASDRINEIYLDPSGTLWISRWAGGVDFTQLEKVKFRWIPGQELALPGESGFIAGPLADAGQGEIWCGSNMAPLRKRRPDGRVDLISLPNGITPRVFQMLALPGGGLLLSTLYEGCFWCDSGARRFVNVQFANGPAPHFNDFCQLKDGRVIGANGRGLQLISLQAGSAVARELPVADVSRHNVLRMYQDQTGQVFLSVDYNKILVLQPAGQGFSLKNSFPVAGAVKTFLEKQDYVWAGGDFGLIRIRTADLALEQVGLAASLPGNTVYSLLPGARNDLWLSTNRGLIRYWPERDSFRNYTLADGLQDYEFNSNSALRTADGRLWFGGIRGLNVFHPDSIADLVNLPSVQITGLRINDQPFAPDSNVSELHRLLLPYDSSTLTFEFVALEFSDPAHNQLKYRLEYADGRPYDPEWVPCTDARGLARYANLPPGAYRFLVMGANSDGVWNPEPRQFFVTITPPFWQTWWFRLLVVAALLLLTFMSVRRYVRDKLRRKNLEIREKNLKLEKQEALTQERNRIAGEMHDDLGGGLTSIRMLSERVQNKLDPSDTRVQVDKIARYSQELVQKMGEIIWAMNSNFDTIENLVAYIRRYAVEYLETNQLRPVIREPETLPDATISGERRRNIYLAVKESLHNIVKHAGAGRVSIFFKTEDHFLIIEVSDDGRGIDLEQVNEFGNGLYNMRKRLLDIGGDMQIANEDGTRIIFSAPFETPHPIP